MADGPGKNAAGGPAGLTAAWARDWLTISQSEWAGMAQDRELAEAWLRWAGRASAAATRSMADAAAGRASADAAAGTPPAMAASDDAFAQLAERVAALERGRAASPSDRDA